MIMLIILNIAITFIVNSIVNMMSIDTHIIIISIIIAVVK